MGAGGPLLIALYLAFTMAAQKTLCVPSQERFGQMGGLQQRWSGAGAPGSDSTGAVQPPSEEGKV